MAQLDCQVQIAAIDKMFLRAIVPAMNREDTRDDGLKRAIAAMGGSFAGLARALGVTRQAVSAWRSVPLERLRAVADITNLPLETLRPDLARPGFPDPPPRPPAGEGG